MEVQINDKWIFIDVMKDPDRFTDEERVHVEEFKVKCKSHPKMHNPTATWSLDDFDIGYPLGRGAFGRVYAAREKVIDHVVALKLMSKKQIIEDRMEYQLFRELDIHARLKHPYILNMFTYFHDEASIFIILEYAGLGDLAEQMRRQPNGRFREELAAKFMDQVTDAVMYCHRRNVVHRDIKPSNILLSLDGDVKLADFGYAVRSRYPRKSVCGTLRYFAPEMVAGTAYDTKVDNWCLGVLCYELLVGKPPFNGLDCRTLFKQIRSLHFKFPPHVSNKAKDLICRLLNESPRERLSLERVRRHPWIIENYKSRSSKKK